MSDFDTDQEKHLRALQRDARGTGLAVAYVDPAGNPIAVTGDDDAPWTEPLARASEDGSTGLIAVPNGANQRIACDEFGHLFTVAAPVPFASTPQRYTSQAAEVGALVKATPGVVYEVHLLGPASVVDLWLHIIDATAVPGPGVQPIWRALMIPPGVLTGETFVSFPRGLGCQNGIVVALSTTEVTLTFGVPTGLFHVQYD